MTITIPFAAWFDRRSAVIIETEYEKDVKTTVFFCLYVFLSAVLRFVRGRGQRRQVDRKIKGQKNKTKENVNSSRELATIRRSGASARELFLDRFQRGSFLRMDRPSRYTVQAESFRRQIQSASNLRRGSSGESG